MPIRKKELVVQLDFGGPILTDPSHEERLRKKKFPGVEEVRRDKALKAAMTSGLFDHFLKNLGNQAYYAKRIRAVDFTDNYSKAKSYLKEIAKGGEAYEDVNRTAATVLMCLRKGGHAEDIEYTQLTKGLTTAKKEKFVKELAKSVSRSTAAYIKPEALRAVADIIRLGKGKGYKVTFDIVTDNSPMLYEHAFAGPIEKAIRNFNRTATTKIPMPKYKKFLTNKAAKVVSSVLTKRHRAYISGEGWGNKKLAQTWGRVLADHKIVINNKLKKKDAVVVFVDDSHSKLNGLDEYAKQVGAKHFYTIHLDLKNEKARKSRIRRMGELHHEIQNILMKVK